MTTTRNAAPTVSAALPAWETGIERAIQRVIAGMALFYTVSASLWAATSLTSVSPLPVTLMVAGVVTLLVVVVRAWNTRIGVPDLVATNVAMVATLGVNAQVGTDGIGIQAGPAYVFMAISLLIAALTQGWAAFWRWAALTISLYVAGRFVGGTSTDLWSGLDETISDCSTIAAAGLVLAFYRTAGRRADEAMRVRLDVSRREAHAVAAQQAAAEERRVLHDEIIAALVSIEHSGATRDHRRAAEVARRARHGLRPETSTERSDGFPSHLVDVTGYRIPVTVEVDAALVAADPVPAEVTVAATGAAKEALRNVERHAGATQVRVEIAPHGDHGARVTISDDGRGLGTDHSPGFGIEQSIVARMEQTGGSAAVRTAPTGGTVVELAWSGERESPSPAEETAATAATAVATVGDPVRFAWSVTLLAVAGQIWLVGRHLSRPAEVPVAVSCVAFVAATAWLAAHRPIGRVTAASLFAIDTALLAWGLAVAGDGALLDFRSWIVELTCVVIFTLAFFVPFRASMLLATLLAAAVAARTALDPSLTIDEVTDPLLQPIFYAAAIGATAWGFRRVSVEIAHEERQAVQRVRLDAVRAAEKSRDEERFARLRDQLDPFFEAVENGLVDVNAPDVADHARILALQVRDEMYLPGLLDDELRTLLAAARRAGASITIRESSAEADGDAVRLLLKAAIDPDTVWRATLSLPSSSAPYFRLVVVPRTPGSLDGRFAAELEPWGVEVEELEHATVLTLPVSPAGVPRRVPS